MLLLGIDTSSQAAGAAIVKDGNIVCESMLNQKKTHSAHMLPMVEQMLAAAEYLPEEMDGFVCGVGPGSFTGVRIGAATIKGFAQVLEKPVVSVNSLETLAFGCGAFEGLTVPLIFARADEVFCAAYTMDSGEPKEQMVPTVMTISELVEHVKENKCLFVGDGALLYREFLCEQCGGNAHFPAARQHMISAANMTLLAERKQQQYGWEHYNDISPLYLRLSQAEREYREKHGGNER